MNNLKIPSDINEKTMEYLQNSRSADNTNNIKIKPKLPGKRKLAVIIAAIMAVMILAGAGLNMIVMKHFEADGNSFLQYIPFRQKFSPINSQTIFERGFFDYENDANKENILGVAYYGKDGVRGGRSVEKTIYDYNELQKYLDENIFILPEYIPDGYKFVSADITFYFDENFDFKTAELITREKKFGNVYEKWHVSGNSGNISGLLISYVKENDGQEMALWYYISLEGSGFIDINFGGSENTKGEILQMPQFDRNILLSTDYTEVFDEPDYTERAFNGIKIIPGITYIRKSGENSIAKEEYGTAAYRIQTRFLSHEEIVKIADSIK